MDYNLKPGMTGIKEELVTDQNTAMAYGSGGVSVYATPAMIGLMENASLSAVDPHLPEGMATVGTRLEVSHLTATPVGMKVRAEAELLEVEGKRLLFKVVAYDEKEKIGEGIHERFIIKLDKFLSKCEEKRKERSN